VCTAVLTLAATPLVVAAGIRSAARMGPGPEEAEEAEPRLSGHIVIVGYGLNGLAVAHVLSESRIPHVVIDEDPDRAEIARRNGSRAIAADAAGPEGLHAAGIARAKAVVVAISDPDGTRRIVRLCRKESPQVHILVRTRYVAQVEALKELGASEVIPAEDETAIEIVSRLMRLLAVPGNVAATRILELRDHGYRMMRDPAMRSAEGRRLSAALEAGAAITFFVLPDTPAEGKTLNELGVADDHVTVPAVMRGGAPYSPAPAAEPLKAGATPLLLGAR